MSRTLFNLSNKVAIITGAASGIGRSTAKLFNTQNARVIASDIDLNGLETLKKEVDHTDNIEIYKVDVTKENEIKDYIDDVYNKYKKINILANIAGVMSAKHEEIFKPLHVRDIDNMKKTIDINVWGSVYHCHYVLNYMLETIKNEKEKGTENPTIINISSEAAERAQPGSTDYTMSKFAIDGLTLSICSEYGASGIRCNAIKPGYTKTALVQNYLDYLTQSGSTKEETDGLISNFLQSVPNERGADAEEIAYLALYLASNESLFCNGSLMRADGGRSVVYGHFPSFV